MELSRARKGHKRGKKGRRGENSGKAAVGEGQRWGRGWWQWLSEEAYEFFSLWWRIGILGRGRKGGKSNLATGIINWCPLRGNGHKGI
jgi:hypothetical protein